jgi:hypothetical protein
MLYQCLVIGNLSILTRKFFGAKPTNAQKCAFHKKKNFAEGSFAAQNPEIRRPHLTLSTPSTAPSARRQSPLKIVPATPAENQISQSSGRLFVSALLHIAE